MHVHYSMERLPEIPSPVVTMGSFDGVHAGHRVIISRLNQLAKLAGGHQCWQLFIPILGKYCIQRVQVRT